MDSTAAALRVERFLETEPVIWLSSIRQDGAPHIVPTWFVWDGETIIIRSKPHAKKVRNLAHDPRAMVALGDAEDDFDVGLLEARAVVTGVGDDGPTPLPGSFLAKYRERIAALGITPAEFAATYSATIRLTPSRALGWHGRSTPRSWLDAVKRLALGRPAPAFVGAA
ncbi:MAG TPA: pyridoxamine 5'-phosphate oxidase family protein [Candidatus Limnocylindrales bacterium]